MITLPLYKEEDFHQNNNETKLVKHLIYFQD
jgi:hypothetical protein